MAARKAPIGSHSSMPANLRHSVNGQSSPVSKGSAASCCNNHHSACCSQALICSLSAASEGWSSSSALSRRRKDRKGPTVCFSHPSKWRSSASGNCASVTDRVPNQPAQSNKGIETPCASCNCNRPGSTPGARYRANTPAFIDGSVIFAIAALPPSLQCAP